MGSGWLWTSCVRNWASTDIMFLQRAIPADAAHDDSRQLATQWSDTAHQRFLAHVIDNVTQCTTSATANPTAIPARISIGVCPMRSRSTGDSEQPAANLLRASA